MKKFLSIVLSVLLLCSVMIAAPLSICYATDDNGSSSNSSEDTTPPASSENDDPDKPLPPVLRDMISGRGDCG